MMVEPVLSPFWTVIACLLLSAAVFVVSWTIIQDSPDRLGEEGQMTPRQPTVLLLVLLLVFMLINFLLRVL